MPRKEYAAHLWKNITLHQAAQINMALKQIQYKEYKVLALKETTVPHFHDIVNQY